MFLDKIKLLFNKGVERDFSPYYYVYETNKNKTIFYMADNLTNKEKISNRVSLKNTNIVSVKQGKKLFFRFLKNNSSYQKYMVYLNRLRLNPDLIIQNNFATPFQCIYEHLQRFDIFKKDSEKFLILEKKWIDFLISIKYIDDYDMKYM